VDVVFRKIKLERKRDGNPISRFGKPKPRFLHSVPNVAV